LFCDGNGKFAAQFMKRVRDSSAAENAQQVAPNNSRAQGGYHAYFATCETDDAAATVAQRLIGALSREYVGQVLTSDDRLGG